MSDLFGPSLIMGITVLPADPSIRSVWVERKVVAHLTVGEVEGLGLAVDMEWTGELAGRVEAVLREGKARRIALVLLGRRAFSRRELIERLEGRRVKVELAERIAAELEEEGWLDDRAYGVAVATELVRKRPASERLIVEKLVGRGIEEGLAELVAAVVLGEKSDVEQARELAEEKLKHFGNMSREKALRRVAGALARRGFDEETIGEVMGEMAEGLEGGGE